MTSSRVPPLAPEVQAAVAHEFRLGRVVSCSAVQTGVMNLNWQFTTDRGTFAVKRLTDRSPEAVRVGQSLLPRLAERGFPVASPRLTGSGDAILTIGDAAYAVNDWILGTHPTGPELPRAACTALGDLVGRLHLALTELCPPAPRQLPDEPSTAAHARAELHRFARLSAESDGFARDEIARRLELLDTVEDQQPPAGDVTPCGWTHGDLNPLNLLVRDGAVVGLLDWDRLGVRPYGLEVVRTATILFGQDLDRIAAFAQGYRGRVPIGLDDAADRRWWTLATETWQLERHFAGDSSCDHLLSRRGGYLYWWTGHRREVSAALAAGSR
ncbi:phosphotransferase [Actinoplanes sp. NPDC020271]|uniref:phosphotransferase n=1 Tax=Actinoplanes sp. NPDC020271 TaxID=3363896 RepID=UPI00379DAB71